jgi:energy-converting hydrogenase B subunit D
MSVLEFVSLTLVGISATAVVLVDDPLRQSMVMGIFGLFLASAFFVLQAPDVALSMIGVSTVLVPVLVLLALARVRDVVAQEERPPPAEEER